MDGSELWKLRGNNGKLSETKQSGLLPLGRDFCSKTFIEKPSILMCFPQAMRYSEYCSTFGFQPHGLSLLAFDLETEVLIHISKFFHTPHERPKYRNLNEERLVNTNQVFPSQTLSHA